MPGGMQQSASTFTQVHHRLQHSLRWLTIVMFFPRWGSNGDESHVCLRCEDGRDRRGRPEHGWEKRRLLSTWQLGAQGHWWEREERQQGTGTVWGFADE